VLKRLLNKLKPDFVLSHSFQFPLATIRFNAVLGNEIPHIIQLHSDRPTGIVLKLLLQMWAYKRTTAFLFTGVEQANGFKKQGIISSNAKVIDCMEGSSSFIPLPRVKLESPTKHLLWVGGLIERKDPFCFIRALSILKRDGLDFQARMVFQTVELKTEVIAAIETEGLGDCIDLVGSVPKQEMQSQYQWAEYFVSTSRHEGSGWALCEAMSMRVIPVVSNIPSHKYMTGEGEFGSLFELGNDSELASILRNLFHGNRDELSRKARQGFDSRLSFQAIANTISNALINL
jgi:glycosyltransferase involved in cell wall biosynthesis